MCQQPGIVTVRSGSLHASNGMRTDGGAPSGRELALCLFSLLGRTIRGGKVRERERTTPGCFSMEALSSPAAREEEEKKTVRDAHWVILPPTLERTMSQTLPPLCMRGDGSQQKHFDPHKPLLASRKGVCSEQKHCHHPSAGMLRLGGCKNVLEGTALQTTAWK